jgi:hypothetical protein
MLNSEEKIKNTIIGIAPKKLGNLVEDIIRQQFCFEKVNKNTEYDACKELRRIEIKSSRALEEIADTDNDYFSYLVSYSRSLIKIEDLKTKTYVCNIQQVKPKLFDDLYYTLVVNEGILVFKMTKKEIKNDKKIAFSGKQHRGNIGEGQFHIKKANIQHHMDTYHIKTLLWSDIFKTLEKIKVKT